MQKAFVFIYLTTIFYTKKNFFFWYERHFMGEKTYVILVKIILSNRICHE